MLKMVSERGDKVLLLLGLSEANIAKLREKMPIRVKVGEVTNTPPTEVVIFAGDTEASMTAELLEAGLVGPQTVVQTPDLEAPFEKVKPFLDTVEEAVDDFLRDNDDGVEYVKQAVVRWTSVFRERYDLSAHDPKVLYDMLVALDMLATSLLHAEDQAKVTGEGPTHDDVLKIMHFISHNGMMLAALKRDL
jgi:hypothetical protein